MAESRSEHVRRMAEKVVNRDGEALRRLAGSGKNAPPGWFGFGYHARFEKVPPLEFSAETDDVGDPLWERPL